MPRQHYIDCGRYILERVFKHVKSFDQPIIFPTVPGSKSYPQPNDPPWRTRAHEFEALERAFNLAAPLIHVDPEASINEIKLRDYYPHHFYNALTPGHPNSLLKREFGQPLVKIQSRHLIGSPEMQANQVE